MGARRRPSNPAELWALTRRTLSSAVEDRVTGLGAEVAFFALLSTPPTLLAVLGSVGYIAEALGPQAAERIQSQIMGVVSTFLTPQAQAGVEDVVNDFLVGGRADVIGVGLLIALWSASRATNAFMQAVAIAYDVPDKRSAVKRRLISLGLTLIGVVGAVVLIPLVVAGPRLGQALGDPLGLGDAFATAWRIGYWPGVLLAGIAFIVLIFHLAPGRRTPLMRDVPGAVVATLLWLIGGGLLRVYAAVSIEGGTTYGPLAAPIVILLFVYVSALALLLGAELNAEIEKEYPAAGRPAPPKE
ncbi:MAG TPA: YihY/virulence factor BrkB family protein [Actinomycetota bacterium]|nr:YihY/virulence factor BrkB family protein [Actinomycetota bacterium]